MKLLFVADLHYALKQFDWVHANAKGCDAVIIGGDLLDLAGHLDLDVQAVVVEEYLNRLRQLTRVFVSSGNHDGDGRDAAGESRARWLGYLKADRLHVDGESVDLAGTRITVCPWWDGPVSRAEVEQQLVAAVPSEGTRWIWVYHAPPEGPLSWTGKVSAGDVFLNECMDRFQPDLVLCGHIHNAPFHSAGGWVQRLGKSRVFNPGPRLASAPRACGWIWSKDRSAGFQAPAWRSRSCAEGAAADRPVTAPGPGSGPPPVRLGDEPAPRGPYRPCRDGRGLRIGASRRRVSGSGHRCGG